MFILSMVSMSMNIEGVSSFAKFIAMFTSESFCLNMFSLNQKDHLEIKKLCYDPPPLPKMTYFFK